MGLFGQNIFREFDEPENGYYFQVVLSKPKEKKIKVNPTRMWETEREALLDLPYIIPRLIDRDNKDLGGLIIKDASILSKFIYIIKVEKPRRSDSQLAKIDDVEYDTMQNYLTKNNIMYKVKIQNNLATYSRNKVVNIALMNLKDSLKKTEYTKKCIKYVIKNDYSYDRFISVLDDSVTIAYYDAYTAIPNPRKNVEALNKFYSELNEAVNKANSDLLRMGYKLQLSGDWDRGFIVLERLSSSIGESNIILYEDPSTLKINGQPVDDEEDEDDDNNKYSIADEPEEDEDTSDEDEGGEETEEGTPDEEDTSDEGGEDEPAEEDEGGDDTEDDAPNDYRINTDDDEGDDTPDEEETTDETEGEEGNDTDETEGEEGGESSAEDDTPNDYRIDTSDGGGGDDNTSGTDGGESDTDDAPNDYRINTDDTGEGDDQGGDAPETGDEGGEDTGGEETAGDEGGGEETTDDGPTDYRVDASGGGDEEATGDEGEASDDTSDEGGEGEGNQEEDTSTKEDEIFVNMSPEQKKIQDMELKDNYIKLYNAIGDLISRIDSIVLDNSNREAVAFVQNQLNEMKDLVYKYLSEVYSTKTYIENNITYQQYLVILSNINNLLVQLNVKSSDVE